MVGVMSKGDFLLHLGPEAHERLRLASEKEGLSMAQLLKEGMELRLSPGQPSSETLLAALALVARAARDLVEQGTPKPRPLSPADPWEALMQDGSS